MSMNIAPFVPGQSIPKPQLPTGNDSAARQGAWRTAQEFEAFFLSRAMDDMFSGVKTDGPMGGGQGESMFRALLNEEYGKIVAGTGGIGIADAVYREIIKLQEGKADAHA
ncbi:MAG: rod-binding protein [Alphaproteobacteria bacterium]|nr:rod-binding protein [Alphaproteobacteria bacterium]